MHSVVKVGDPVLRAKAQAIPIKDISSPRIQNLVKEMQTLLAREEYGVAMAAPQIGESLRLFIVSGKATEKRDGAVDEGLEQLPSEDEVYINPVLTKMSRGRKDMHEGCLSIRSKWGMVPRAEKATVRAYNERGMQFTRGASGLLAHIFQHEIDHLNGVLYIDKATKLYDDQATNTGKQD